MAEPINASALQAAYIFIRDRIQGGSFVGGDRIKPEDVAAKLGISRMPVREAIRQLGAEGLVTIRPNRSAIVTLLGADDLTELFAMRAALEGAAMRAAAGLIGADDLEEAALLLGRLDRARGDVDAWLAHHEAFHDFLCRRSGWPRIAAEVARLRSAAAPYLRISLRSSSAAMDTAEHRLILDALRTGDSELAEMVMRKHIQSTVRTIVA